MKLGFPSRTLRKWKNVNEEIDTITIMQRKTQDAIRANQDVISKTGELCKQWDNLITQARSNAQSAEDKLAQLDGISAPLLPKFVLSKDQFKKLDKRPPWNERLWNMTKHVVTTAKDTIGRFVDTGPGTWEKTWQKLVSRTIPFVGIAAGITTAILTAGVVVPISIGIASASALMAMHHVSNNADEAIPRNPLDYSIPRSIGASLFGIGRLLGRAIVHPITTIRFTGHSKSHFPLLDLTDDQANLRRDRRELRNTFRDLRQITYESARARETAEVVRQSTAAFKAWRDLANWDARDEVQERANLSRSLRAEYRARAALREKEVAPESTIDLSSLDAINTTEAGESLATEDLQVMPDATEPKPVLTKPSSNGKSHEPLEISHSTLELAPRNSNSGGLGLNN